MFRLLCFYFPESVYELYFHFKVAYKLHSKCEKETCSVELWETVAIIRTYLCVLLNANGWQPCAPGPLALTTSGTQGRWSQWRRHSLPFPPVSPQDIYAAHQQRCRCGDHLAATQPTTCRNFLFNQWLAAYSRGQEQGPISPYLHVPSIYLHYSGKLCD